MNIIVIGATGMVGSRLVAEAIERGHHVTAAARTPDAYSANATVQPRALDASSAAQLETVLSDSQAEVIVLAVRSRPGAERTFSKVTSAVLTYAARTGVRVLVIGGAAPLQSPDDPDLLVGHDTRYVPASWQSMAMVSADQLHTCQEHPHARWTYVSPPAQLSPGDRTGSYRRGTTTLLTAADGSSSISAEDLSIAVLDEAENPSVDRHFTVVRSG